MSTTEQIHETTLQVLGIDKSDYDSLVAQGMDPNDVVDALGMFNDLADKKTITSDLESMVSNLAPANTPFISSIGNSMATATLHEWLEDDIETGSRIRYGNDTQIFAKTIETSGDKDEVTERLALAAANIKSDIELAFLTPIDERNGAIPEGATPNTANSSTARMCKSMFDFKDSVDFSTDLGSLDELCAEMYQDGCTPDILMLSPKDIITLRKGKESVPGANTIQTDIATLHLVPNYHLKPGRGLLYCSSHIKEARLRELEASTLGNQTMIIKETTLQPKMAAFVPLRITS